MKEIKKKNEIGSRIILAKQAMKIYAQVLQRNTSHHPDQEKKNETRKLFLYEEEKKEPRAL